MFNLKKTKNMDNNTILNSETEIEVTANYHQQLLEQYSDPKVLIPSNIDTPKLIPFNGYYTLDSAPGAFFAIDTNMIIRPSITNSESKSEYLLSLLISLDGKTSNRYAFTGTFDGSNLVQKWTVGGLDINLTFTRPNNNIYGTTVTCKGSITLPGSSLVFVSGSTYNNPIPASLYKGDYYSTPIIDKPSIKVMSIGENNKLMYDNGTNDGNLNEVETYIYNLNMYYFSLAHGITQVKLIMGTAAAQGFACNNMSTIGKNLTTRSLTTIPKGVAPKPQLYDLSDVTLADFSGYYQIPTKENPLAFVSIQAQYISLATSKELELNFVMISHSLDGVTSTGYFFDPLTGMTFDTTLNTLMVPASSGQKPLVLTFNRQYDESTGALVSITGNIDGNSVSGNTLFNPVPLSAFSGVTMTNNDGDELTINNDNSVTYTSSTTVVSGSETETDKKTATYNSLIYVPLMYIVAAPADAPTFELSLGTDGLRGNTSIVIEKDKNTTAVYAINGSE